MGESASFIIELFLAELLLKASLVQNINLEGTACVSGQRNACGVVGVAQKHLEID